MNKTDEKETRHRGELPPWEDMFSGRGLSISVPAASGHRVAPPSTAFIEAFDPRQGDANFVRHHYAEQAFDFVLSEHLLAHLMLRPSKSEAI